MPAGFPRSGERMTLLAPDVAEREERLIWAIKDMLDAQELGPEEWANLERTANIETRDLR